MHHTMSILPTEKQKAKFISKMAETQCYQTEEDTLKNMMLTHLIPQKDILLQILKQVCIIWKSTLIGQFRKGCHSNPMACMQEFEWHFL